MRKRNTEGIRDKEMEKSMNSIPKKGKQQHLFRNDKVELKKKERWKVIKVHNDLTLMERDD